MADHTVCDVCKTKISHPQDKRRLSLEAPDGSGSCFPGFDQDLCVLCGNWLLGIMATAARQGRVPCVSY